MITRLALLTTLMLTTLPAGTTARVAANGAAPRHPNAAAALDSPPFVKRLRQW